MLEIFLVIYFKGKIAVIAEQKGEKPGSWKLYVVLSWFGAEIFGIIAGIIIFGSDNLAYLLPGYGCAIGSYFIVKSRLVNMPDAYEEVSTPYEEVPAQIADENTGTQV